MLSGQGSVSGTSKVTYSSYALSEGFGNVVCSKLGVHPKNANDTPIMNIFVIVVMQPFLTYGCCNPE